MKKIGGTLIFRSLLVFLLFMQAVVKAQDSTISSHSQTVHKNHNNYQHLVHAALGVGSRRCCIYHHTGRLISWQLQ